MVPLDFPGSSLWSASLRLMERPFFLTSHKRTKRSACGLSVRCTSSTTGFPIASSGSFNGGLVNVRTSSRFSSSRLSRYPPIAGLMTERLTESHRSPHGVLRVRRREPLPVRHRAACEDRFLGTDQRKLLKPGLQASAGRHEAQDPPDQTTFRMIEAVQNAQRRFECKAPVPCVTQWLSCAETAIAAAASSGGGSVIKAQAVYPRYDAPHSANRPPNQACPRSQATVSAPSSMSGMNGWKSPPEPKVPRQLWWTTW
jgi:hypothetical protein